MGPNYSISTACATSNFCILNAANHIIRGEAVSIFALLCALRILDFSYFPLPFLFWTKFGSMMLSFCQKVLTNLVNMKFVCRMWCFVVAQMLLLYQLVSFYYSFSVACVKLSFHEYNINPAIIGAGLGGFVACRALSQRNTDPTKASRPWDIVILYKYSYSPPLLKINDITTKTVVTEGSLVHQPNLKCCVNFC